MRLVDVTERIDERIRIVAVVVPIQLVTNPRCEYDPVDVADSAVGIVEPEDAVDPPPERVRIEAGEHRWVSRHGIGVAVPVQKRLEFVLVRGVENSARQHRLTKRICTGEIPEDAFGLLSPDILPCSGVVVEIRQESDRTPTVLVEFEYVYDGTRYAGTKLYLAAIERSYETRAAAESAIDEYERGTQTTAYVGPDEPSDAF